jgi:hemerythrin
MSWNSVYKSTLKAMRAHQNELQALLLALAVAGAAFSTTEESIMNDKVKVLLEEALDFLNGHIAKIDALVNEVPAGPEGKLAEEAATALVSEVVPALDAEVHSAT